MDSLTVKLFNHIKQTQDSLLDVLEEDNECIFLLGTKAVGKSALAHYLAGNGLAMEFDEVLGYKKVVLSDGSKQEETIISNLLRFSDDQKTILIDTPGISSLEGFDRHLSLYTFQHLIAINRPYVFTFVYPGQLIPNVKSIFEEYQAWLGPTFVAKLDNFSVVLSGVHVQDQEEQDQIELFMTEVKEVTEDVLIQKIKKDNVFLFMAQDEFKTEEGISLRKQILKTSAIKLFEGKPDDSWLKISMGTLSEEEVAAYEKSFKQLSLTLSTCVSLLAIYAEYHYSGILDKYKQVNKNNALEALREIARKMPILDIKLEFSKQNYIQDRQLQLTYFIRKFPKPVSIRSVATVNKFIDKLVYNWGSISQERVGYDTIFIESVWRQMSTLYQALKFIEASVPITTKGDLLKTMKRASAEYSRIFTGVNQVAAKMLADPENTAYFELADHEDELNILRSYELANQSTSKYVEGSRPQDSAVLEYKCQTIKNEWRKNQEPKKKSSKYEIKEEQSTISSFSLLSESSDEQSLARITALHLDSQAMTALLNEIREVVLHKRRQYRRVQQIALLTKCSIILQRYSMIEEAIEFLMVIPDSHHIERLVLEGIKIGCITKQFVKEVLVPYFVRICPERAMLVRCYNFIGTQIFNPEEYVLNQQNLEQSLLELEAELTTSVIMNYSHIQHLLDWRILIDRMKDMESRFQRRWFLELVDKTKEVLK